VNIVIKYTGGYRASFPSDSLLGSLVYTLSHSIGDRENRKNSLLSSEHNEMVMRLFQINTFISRSLSEYEYNQ
jgi:hypothetical protein